MRVLIGFFMAASLVACTSADMEGMQTGLQKSGMTSQQASCYAGELKSLIGAKPYNNMSEKLNAGDTLKDAINKTRRKYGSEFKDKINEGQNELDTCLK